MPGARHLLEVLVTGNSKGAIAALDQFETKANRSFGAAKTKSQQFEASLVRGGAAAVGLAAVTGAGLLQFVKASEEAQRSQLKLNVAVGNSKVLAAGSQKSFEDLADVLMAKTVVDDDAVKSAESVLVTMGLTEDQILSLTPLVVDLSRKMGVDLDTAAKTVAKSVDGNAGSLQRMGIEVDAADHKTNAFAATVDALRGSVGGFAEEEGKTFSGRLEIFKNQLGEVSEGIGVGVVDALSRVLGPLTSVSNKFSELSPQMQQQIGWWATIGTAIVGAGGAISFTAGQALKLRTRFTDGAGGLNNFGKAAGAAALAGVGLGVALTAVQLHAEESEERVDKLVDQVKTLNVTLGEASGNVLADWIAKNGEERAVLDDLKISIRDVNKAIQGSKAEYQRVIRPIREYATGLHSAADSGERFRANRLAGAIEEQRESFGKARGNIEQTNEATEELRKTQLDTTSSTGDLGDAAGDTAEKVKTLEEVTRELMTRNREADEAQRDYTSAVFGTRDAARDLEEANFDLLHKVEGYNAAVGAGTQGTEEFAAAEREAKAAVDEVAQAADEAAKQQAILTGAHYSAQQSADVQKLALQQLASSMAPGSPLRLYIEGLIGDLNKMTAAGQNTINTLTGGGRTFGGLFGGATDITRAAGGPVSAHTAYVVGERGPELFVPGTSGTVVPNHALKSAAGGVVINAPVTFVGGDIPTVTQLDAQNRKLGIRVALSGRRG